MPRARYEQRFDRAEAAALVAHGFSLSAFARFADVSVASVSYALNGRASRRKYPAGFFVYEWCPAHLRPTYDQHRRKGLSASEARHLIEIEHALEGGL